MKAKDVGALLLLSALWGGSFLFMRIAAPVLGPVVLIELRVLIAGIALLLYSIFTRRNLDLRKRWLHYLVIGIINSAIPFTLIATAELHLTAGFAAILNATSPLFGAVVAAIWIKEALTTRKVIGLLLGLVGVGVLVGWSSLPFSATVVFSVVASLVAAAFYGLASVYTKVYTRGASSVAVTTCSQIGASLFLLPLVPIVPAQHPPTLTVVLAVAALALLCTGFAYLLYFQLIENVGPTRALTVNFLSPVFGVLWGVLLLNEALTWSTIVGFGIILAGTGFVTGVLRLRKEQEIPVAPLPNHSP
jgi:drug/metabolite transporter (DMT)-like permease